MGFGDDEEILQDFLVEAGEIIEQLSEQLVDLEQKPDDKDLLNAIFRGFHTVKGGAGFLQLHEMVECCHVTENLFDILRNGQRQVTAELMDVVLRALDTVTVQFNQLQKGESPSAAEPSLIQDLETLVAGGDLAETPAEPDVVAHPDPLGSPAEASPQKTIDITDSEFEDFLDAITDEPAVEAAKDAVSPAPAASNDITDDEFEALLDQLHGAGKGPSVVNVVAPAPTLATPPTSQTAPAASASPTPSAGDDISDQEFEDLLDALHGSGKGPGTASVTPPSSDTSVSHPPAPQTPAVEADKPAAGDNISDDEFESLLDQLHGAGKGPSAVSAPVASTPPPPSAPPSSTSVPKTPPPQPPKSSSGASAVAPTAPKVRDTPAVSSSGAQADATVRVDTQRLDDIMNMVGELVLVRNRLVRLGLETSDESMQKAVANLDVVTADLQTAVMKTRMQPIKKVFGRFPRVVRDLARNLKKEINLELQGEETDLDKNLVEALADPLVHLVRNSVDHGIELPLAREKIGKPRVGKIVLAAEQEGDHILLSITDDGGGMDPEALRQKAVEKGLFDADTVARLSDVEAFNLIFAPGFSTKQEISDVSGRGVGMDVVKTKITQLNGSIAIHSKIEEGTRIAIKVPLTLAIMPTLMIMLGRQTFALPLVSVNEIFHMDLTKANIVDGQECITIREKAVPIFHLKNWLVVGECSREVPREGHVVIVSVGTQRVGFVVDQLIGQEEVVIKPLGKMLHGTPGMAGATITGDGTIALILDVPSMLKRYAGR